MILLIRHGETALNAARVIQTPDTPLHARGIAQAERLARRLRELGVARILSSDLPRALMTAEPIAAAFAGVEIERTALLQERNFGDIRGTPYASIGRDIFARDYVPPGGESWDEFDARVRAAWALVVETARATEGNLAVVTHGLVCRSMADQLLGLPAGQPPPLRWGNTSLTLCSAEPPHSVTLLNCTAHLESEDDSSLPSGM